jgi:hypothetical protein
VYALAYKKKECYNFGIVICFGVCVMYCENFLCIYQSQGQCILDEIRLDGLGMCTECIYPNFEQEILNQMKKDLLEKYGEMEE